MKAAMWGIDGSSGRWARAVLRIAALVGAGVLTSCGGPASCGGECALDDIKFYNSTWLAAAPSSMVVNPGEDASAFVTVAFDDRLSRTDTALRSFRGVSIVPPTPGVTLVQTNDPCVVPPGIPLDSYCATHRLMVSADAIAAGVRIVTISAIWFDDPDPREADPRRTLERVETFRVSLPPPPATPDFQLDAGTPATEVHATRGIVPVAIVRTLGFAEPVTLGFDALGSGITGTFKPNPSSSDRSSLVLELPARYAVGGLVPLRVTGSASGRTRSVDFTQRVEPIFRMSLSPASGNLDVRSPLDIEVTVTFNEFGPYALENVGPVELSAPGLPPGVSATFLPDAMPRQPAFPVLSVKRTMRLSTDGSTGGGDTLQVHGSAIRLPGDLAGVRPYVEVPLLLDIVPGLFWEFVGNTLSNGLSESDTVGIAMQSTNDQPAVAWIEGARTARRVYLKRFDGTTFNASPAGALVAPSATSIVEADVALTRADVATVAFTYEDGARLGIGTAGTSWSIGSFLIFGTESDAATGRARSPRIATGNGDSLTLSYVATPAASATGGNLLVRRGASGSLLSVLAGPGTGGSVNHAATGRALNGTTALALRPDGNPWVAWIEQPADVALPAALWLRSHDGTAWGAAIPVPTVRPLFSSAVKLLVEPSGGVVVSWLEGSPSQVKLARLDPSNGMWTALSNTGNGEGSLNIGQTEPALDVSLGLDAGGRLVVAWTQGGLLPRVWVKRQNADTTWGLLGNAVSDPAYPARSPRIVGNANSNLFVAWTRLLGDLPDQTRASDVFVARWIYP